MIVFCALVEISFFVFDQIYHLNSHYYNNYYYYYYYFHDSCYIKQSAMYKW